MEGSAARDLASERGDDVLAALTALANPHRLRVLGLLSGGRQYVSQLAREAGLSRPLLYMHLNRLQSAGLVSGTLELSEEDGKAMKYFEIIPFVLHLTPERIAAIAATLGTEEEREPAAPEDVDA